MPSLKEEKNVDSSACGFGYWRSVLCPLYRSELRKFVPLVLIMFCVLFNYTTVRNIKDSLIISSTINGNLVISWIKVVFVVPSSILFVITYAKLSDKLSKSSLYIACLVPFAVFFLLFAGFIYPNRWALQASPETVLKFKKMFPALQDLVPAIGYWCYTSFYVVAEIWGNVGLQILFWQLANQITNISEAKRVYPLFGLGANLGMVSAGLLTIYSEKILVLPSGHNNFCAQVSLYSWSFVFCCIIILAAYSWLCKTCGKNCASLAKAPAEKRTHKAISLRESFRHIVSSKYIICIAILVVSYNLTINITEVVWKGQIGEVYKSERAINAFMGYLYITLGITTILFTLVSKNFIKAFGWLFSASVTPLIMAITSCLFFALMLSKDSAYILSIARIIGTSPEILIICVGFFQNVFCRGSKYALFDPTKEMAYIPLNDELKMKGKAAVDLVASRAAKSSGGVVITSLNFVLNKVGAIGLIYPMLSAVTSIICIAWFATVRKMSVFYKNKLD
ncbi:Npt1/Npt2 family nucleotide transporter [Candidatus Hydrogenosomobacter endosymbioticus]|nr:Npt1/Npt2 family nucleotide transporter [Candidatus Hydrogenosomobacter endosymbioticus]